LTVINWQDLKFLTTLSRAKSLAHAADELNVNRTTVSRRIERLERCLGTKLVQRLGRDLVLTASGQEAILSAEIVTAEIQSLERRLAGRDGCLSGTIRLTTTPRLARLISADLACFSEKHPDVVLEVSATRAQEDLELMEADVALRLTVAPPERLVGRKLGEPTSALYASHELARHLAHLDCVDCIANPLDPAVPQRVATELGKEARIRFRTDSLDVARDLVAGGRGIGSLPCYVGEGDSSLVRISSPYRSGMPDVWMLYHPRLRNDRRFSEFARHLVETFDRLRPLIEGASAIGSATAGPETIDSRFRLAVPGRRSSLD
jgi:DNA-binding transcriptional LysR family regulator